MFPSNDFLSSIILFSTIESNFQFNQFNNYYYHNYRCKYRLIHYNNGCLLSLYHSCYHQMSSSSTTTSSSSASSASETSSSSSSSSSAVEASMTKQLNNQQGDHINGDQVTTTNNDLNLIHFFKKMFGKIFEIISQPSTILLALIILSYWPTFFNEFVFDDRPTIVDNKDVNTDETSWTQLWFNDYWGHPLHSPLSHKSYRPLTIITFRFNYFIHQLLPFGYHLLNILLHFIVTLLFYRLCQHFYRPLHYARSLIPAVSASSSSTVLSGPKLSSTPFIMTALFAVHPIHTDCVCSIVGRAELLSAICYLSSILLWNLYNNNNNSNNKSINNNDNNNKSIKCNNNNNDNYIHNNNTTNNHNKYLILSILMAIIGFHCKEQSIFVLLYLCINQLFINNSNINAANGDNNNLNLNLNNNIGNNVINSIRNDANNPTNYNNDHHQRQQQHNHNHQYHHHHHHYQQRKQRKNSNRSIMTLSTTSPVSLSSVSSSKTLSSTNSVIMTFNKYVSSSLLSPLSSSSRIIIMKKLPLISILIIIFSISIVIRFRMINNTLPLFNRFDNPTIQMTPISRILSIGYIILYHFWLLLCPYYLSCDWTHSSIELIDFNRFDNDNQYNHQQHTYFNAIYYRTVLVISIFSFAIYYGFKWLWLVWHRRLIRFDDGNDQCNNARIDCNNNRITMKRLKSNQNKAKNSLNLSFKNYENQMIVSVILSLSLIIIPFIPCSNIFYPVGFVIAERILYLPSIGFLLLFGIGVDLLTIKLTQFDLRKLIITSNNVPWPLMLIIRKVSSLLFGDNVNHHGNDGNDNDGLRGHIGGVNGGHIGGVNGGHNGGVNDNDNNDDQQQRRSRYRNLKNVKMFNPNNRNNQNHLIYRSRTAILAMIVAIFSIRTFIRSYDWKSEQTLFEAGLRVNPTNTKLLNNLGRIYESYIEPAASAAFNAKDDHDDQTKQIEMKTIELYRKAIRIEPNDLRSYLNLGNFYLKHSNNTMMAENVYWQALRQFDDDHFGQKQLQLKQLQRHENNYRSIDSMSSTTTTMKIDQFNNNNDNNNRLSPLYITLLIRLIDLLSLNQTKSNELKLIEKRLIRIQLDMIMIDDDHSMMMMMAERQNQNSMIKTASLRHYFHDNFDDYQLNQLYNLGVLQYQQGNILEAFDLFEKILSINPNHLKTLIIAAQIIKNNRQLYQKHKHLAYKYYKRLITMGYDDETILFNFASIEIDNGNYRHAKLLLEKAIEKRQTFFEAHYNLALLLVKQMDAAIIPIQDYHNDTLDQTPIFDQQESLFKAIDHLKQVLMIEPNHLNSMFILGELYTEKLNQFDVAKHYYRLILKRIDNNNLHARHNICILLQKQNKLEKSLKCFENLMKFIHRSVSIFSPMTIDNFHQLIIQQMTYVQNLMANIGEDRMTEKLKSKMKLTDQYTDDHDDYHHKSDTFETVSTDTSTDIMNERFNTSTNYNLNYFLSSMMMNQMCFI